MSKKKPDHKDAELVLHLYELRRESVMRASRATMGRFLPKSFEDVAALTSLTHPDNAAWRQFTSYWEMAYGFARHGILPADFLAENGGEGLFFFAKIAPYLKRVRKEISPLAFRNAEWMVEKSSAARQRFDLFKKRVAAQLAASAEKLAS